MESTYLDDFHSHKENSSLHIYTLGGIKVDVKGNSVHRNQWGRDKTLQLFQFFVTSRTRHALHKEQIVDRLWPDSDMKGGNRDFKVSLSGIFKVIEPDRKPREESKYIRRQGVSYELNMDALWIDAEEFDIAIESANRYKNKNEEAYKDLLSYACSLYNGTYLPDRMYEDWSSTERERLQVLAINAMVSLGELHLNDNPEESIRLAQEVLLIDRAWEEAYRLMMRAYTIKKNRPQVLKTYAKCVDVLEEEFGISPLPETRALVQF